MGVPTMSERYDLRIRGPKCECELPEGEFALGGLHLRRVSVEDRKGAKVNGSVVKTNDEGQPEVCPAYAASVEQANRERKLRTAAEKPKGELLDV